MSRYKDEREERTGSLIGILLDDLANVRHLCWLAAGGCGERKECGMEPMDTVASDGQSWPS